MLLKKKITSDSIVFLGDSLTEWFNLENYFLRKDIVNRGVAGDITDGVLYRLEEITAAAPKEIFLMIGINDIFQGYGVEQITRNLKTIIDRIIEDTPSSKLTVQSILPINEDYFPIGDNMNSKINAVNEQLEGFCRLRKVKYINLHEHFLYKGKLNPEYTYDGGHLTEKGYEKWAQLLQAHL